jgi:hypothetical protein
LMAERQVMRLLTHAYSRMCGSRWHVTAHFVVRDYVSWYDRYT